MKLNEVVELVPYNMFKNINWGKRKRIRDEELVMRDTKTGKVFGRRKIARKY